MSKNILEVPITQARCTQVELDQAKARNQLVPGRVYFLTDEQIYVGAVAPNLTQILGSAQPEAVSYRLPGTGNVWEDANAHTFTGPYSDGEGRLPIGNGTMLTIGHNGVLYFWFGPRPVCIGAGGPGGIYPHHIVVEADLMVTGLTSHTVLDDLDAADSHPMTAITGLVTALAAKLRALADDPDPHLGARLFSDDNVIALSRPGDQIDGLVGRALGINGDFIFFARTDETGVWDQVQGAIVADDAGLHIYGSSVHVLKLENPAGTGKGQQVYVTDEGLLYGVDPPDPGWELVDTDTGVYDLGNGTAVGPWVELTGLGVTIAEDVAAGQRVDVYGNVSAQNKTTNRSGEIEVGFGVNGVAPASGQIKPISAGFDGYVVANVTTTTHGGLSPGDTITAFARRASGSHGQFGVLLDGSGADPHELIVSSPVSTTQQAMARAAHVPAPPVTVSGNITLDLAEGDVHEVVLDGDADFGAVDNAVDGARFTLLLSNMADHMVSWGFVDFWAGVPPEGVAGEYLLEFHRINARWIGVQHGSASLTPA